MSEKSEKATPKREREARKKGQVAKSQDLNSAVVFLAVTMVLFMTGKQSATILSTTMQNYIGRAFQSDGARPEEFYALLVTAGVTLLKVLAPIMLAGVIAGAGLSYAQVGSLFSMEPLQPKLDKLDPIKGFKNKFFSARAYIELAKSLLKILVIGLVLWGVIKGDLRDVGQTLRTPLKDSFALLGKLLFGMVAKSGAILLAFGAADVGIQRWQHQKQLMMSKDDVKREYKESEGDPHLKGERKHLMKEIAFSDVRTAVRKAKVVIVNPTHVAVAVQYERGEMGAPQVAAKGIDEAAQRIREFAKEFGIPIRRDVPLAHALNALEVGTEMPPELYTAMAEVLTWVAQGGRE